jgi:hypothetical protein
VAAPIRDRIFRYYLNERYRVLPGEYIWRKEELRWGELTLTVEDVSASRIQFLVEGRARIATDADIQKAEGGYQGELFGRAEYDLQKKAFTRFDLLAVGENWWTKPHRVETLNQSLGRITVGVAFQLASNDSGSPRVVPGANWPKDPDYWGAAP